jgi:hypothetical protein
MRERACKCRPSPKRLKHSGETPRSGGTRILSRGSEDACWGERAPAQSKRALPDGIPVAKFHPTPVPQGVTRKEKLAARAPAARVHSCIRRRKPTFDCAPCVRLFLVRRDNYSALEPKRPLPWVSDILPGPRAPPGRPSRGPRPHPFSAPRRRAARAPEPSRARCGVRAPPPRVAASHPTKETAWVSARFAATSTTRPWR